MSSSIRHMMAQLRELLSRTQAVSPGPWYSLVDSGGKLCLTSPSGYSFLIATFEKEDVCYFTAVAFTHLPALLDELDTCHDIIARMMQDSDAHQMGMERERAAIVQMLEEKKRTLNESLDGKGQVFLMRTAQSVLINALLETIRQRGPQLHLGYDELLRENQRLGDALLEARRGK